MTVKEYCEYTLELRKRIRAKERLIEKLRGSAVKDTPCYGTVAVQNNGSKHPMADTADAFMDQEAVLRLEKEQLRKMLQVIGIAFLELTNADHIAILQTFYIDGLSGSETMKTLKISKTTLYRRRSEALERLHIPQEELDLMEFWKEAGNFSNAKK